MTDKQTKFYWQLWNRACKANAWHMQDCRLQNAEVLQSEISNLKSEILVLAHNYAAAAHRGILLDDIRHAVHALALSSVRPVSSKQITPKQFGRVMNLLKLLINPDDLEAMNEWLHPENDERRQLIGRIKQAPYAYVVAITVPRFGTRNWEELGLRELQQLAMTVSNRNRTWRKPFQPVPAYDETNAPY